MIDFPDFTLRMTICICHLTASTTQECLQYNALRWLSVDRLPTLDLATADTYCYLLVARYLNPYTPAILLPKAG